MHPLHPDRPCQPQPGVHVLDQVRGSRTNAPCAVLRHNNTRAKPSTPPLTFTFPYDPRPAAVVTSSVGSDDSYQVQGCTPEIEADRLEGLVMDVNDTNDFGRFVRQMRKAFKELV